MTQNFVSGWHENLGMSSEQASELYQSNPEDPQILRWKGSLQTAIQDIQVCFDSPMPMDDVLRAFCDFSVDTVYKECIAHPNTLLGCINPGIAQYMQKDNLTGQTSNMTT